MTRVDPAIARAMADDAEADVKLIEPGDKRLPLDMIQWRLLVQPLPPKRRTDGGIYTVEQTQNADAILTVVGRVLQMGAACFKARTPGGIELAQEPLNPKVGDWIMYGRYAGQEIYLQDAQHTKLIMVNDTDVLAVVKDPEAFRRLI